jgi:hypothetical protein
MIVSRRDLAENLLRLKDNAHWRYYVSTLEETYNRQVQALLVSDHPDEALRGECRALLTMLRTISKDTTL